MFSFLMPGTVMSRSWKSVICVTQNEFCSYFDKLHTMAEASVPTWHWELSTPYDNIDRLLVYISGLYLEFP